MATSTGKLIISITDWLEHERGVYFNAATEIGIEPSIEMEESRVTNITETGLQNQSTKINISPIAIPRLSWKIMDALEGRETTEESPAQELYERYGGRSKIWNPMLLQVVFEDSPSIWIHDTLLVRLRHSYLAEIESLENAQRDLAKSLAKDLLKLLEDDMVNFVTALPLAGIRFSEDPIEVDNILFRTMTSRELGLFLEESTSHALAPRPRRSLSTPFRKHINERWVLEMRTSCDKLAHPMAGLQAQKLILALQLLGFELQGNGFATNWTEPGPSLWSGGQQFRLAERGETKDCSFEELERALALSSKIPDGAINKPTNRQELVLHRFFLGATDSSQADAIIDYVIALEGFLLPASKQGEYKFKFSLFGARYIGSSPKRRVKFFGDLGHIYDTRSEIVHGLNPPNEEKLNRDAIKARKLASRMITKALEEGWPSVDELKMATLRSS